jgi:hypothetical protein
MKREKRIRGDAKREKLKTKRVHETQILAYCGREKNINLSGWYLYRPDPCCTLLKN